MRRWQKEPSEFALLVAHSGTRADAVDFLREWTAAAGDTNLSAAPLSGDSRLLGSLVFAVNALPDYGLLGYWLRRKPNWHIFYWRESLRASLPGPAAGYYSPWGFEHDLPDTTAATPVLVTENKNYIPITARFANAFEVLKVNFLAPALLPAREVSQSASPQPLPVELVPQSSRPLNAAFELARLQERVLEMQAQTEALAWWCGEAEFDVQMHIYVEDRRLPQPPGETRTRWFDDRRGKVGALRQWFTSVPASWLDEFKHARVEVEGLLALHLVIPKQYGHVPGATLPETPWRLLLDRNWRRKQRDVFVSEGYVLRPAPPIGDNPVVTGLLADALWNCSRNGDQSNRQKPRNGGDTVNVDGKDILVILRSAEAGEHRFTVASTAFQSLAGRAYDLNFEVGIAWHEFPQRRGDYVNEAASGAAKQIESHFKTQKNAMDEALAKIWTTSRQDVQAHRKNVWDALSKISELEKLLKRVEDWGNEITGFQIAQRNIWISFVKEVLQRHATLPPLDRDPRLRWLREVVSIEQHLTNLDLSQAGSHTHVTALLRGLADNIDRQRAPLPAEVPPNDDTEQF